MCDTIMEAISVALSKEYLKEFGAILHHNIGKGLLAAGRVRKRFGGGKVLKSMKLIIGDRATFMASGKKIPVADIQHEPLRMPGIHHSASERKKGFFGITSTSVSSLKRSFLISK